MHQNTLLGPFHATKMYIMLKELIHSFIFQICEHVLGKAKNCSRGERQNNEYNRALSLGASPNIRDADQ